MGTVLAVKDRPQPGRSDQRGAEARLPLSVFLIVRNEARRLSRTLEAVAALADDIVVVDSGSTDETCAIARAFGARVIVNTPFPGYGEQKRFAEAACRHDWVLNVDADEVISQALRQEIRALLSQPRIEADGYAVKIVEVLPGEESPAEGAHGLSAVRLYRRSRGSYNPSPVHDRVEMADGAVTARLRGVVEHHSILTLDQFAAKLSAYSALQAADAHRRGRRVSSLRVGVEFPYAFLRAYVGRRQFRRGVVGFLMALHYALFRTTRMAKIHALGSENRTLRALLALDTP